MAYYDLRKKPALTTKEGEKKVFYPQVINMGTVPAEELIKMACQRSGLKKGDMKGMLATLFDTVTDWINMGYSVELGDFGYFAGKIKGRLVEKKTDIRAQSVRLNNVNFRASAKFKKSLSGELSRVSSMKFRQSSNLSMEELEEQLLKHLDEKGFINRVSYTRLTGRLKWKATQDLNFFVEKGLIMSHGKGNQKHYVKVKNWR